ncbi:MAG TPA: hypothetical protein VIG30_15375 [Ktedonobacterales bacterium]|jgi:hypothetical protein
MRQMVDRVRLAQGQGDRRDWFRLGMASATIATPLVSRWRALRAAERARALWQASQAGARWPWAHPASAVEEKHLPPLARRDVRTGLWLAGVAVGLGVAGTAAFIIARRRLRVDEPPLDLPLITHAAKTGAFGAEGVLPPRPRASEAGAGAALPTGGEDVAAAPANGTIAPTPPTVAHAVADMAPPPAPRYVGNTRTLLYVSADGADLPPEEVRVYFASEAQATQAGYHATPGTASAPDASHP